MILSARLLRSLIMKYSVEVSVPARIGDKLSAVDTPALIVNRKALLRNLQRMADLVSRSPTKILLRPHSKTHKCPELARLQVEKYAAVGVCCQKLDEMECMLQHGINDVFLSNECVGTLKINRLCELAKKFPLGKLSVVVDDPTNVLELGERARRYNVMLDVLVEVNGGHNRGGVNVLFDNAAQCVDIAKTIESYSPYLRFKGIHCYGGYLQHIRKCDQRLQLLTDGPVRCASVAQRALAAEGISCDVITGAGTGTFKMEMASMVFNEIQPGSYCMMDRDYGDNEDGTGEFDNALFIHTTVTSKAVDGANRAVVDAGMKACSHDSGPPVLIRGFMDGGDRVGGVKVLSGGDEHGIIVSSSSQGILEDNSSSGSNNGGNSSSSPGSPAGADEGSGFISSLRVADTVRLVPGHIDPTINMHHFLVVMDEDPTAGPGSEPIVVDIWPILGRSPGF